MPFSILSNYAIKLRNRHFLLIDILMFLLTPTFALFLRYDGNYNYIQFNYKLVILTLLFALIKIASIYFMGLYKRLWHLASIDEVARFIIVGTVIALLEVYTFGLLRRSEIIGIIDFPSSLPWFDSFISIALVSSSRFSVRLLVRINQRLYSDEGAARVLVVGAGESGVQIVSEIQKNPHLKLLPVGYVDDDLSKKHTKIRGVYVLGSTKDISIIVEKYKIKRIIIAMPTATGEEIRNINSICITTGAEIQIVPGVYEILDGVVSISKLRKMKIEDLMRRKPVNIDNQAVIKLYGSKIVLITGAGGSIGSELVRQIFNMNPQKIIILGHGENSIFELEQELKFRLRANYSSITSGIEIVPIIADVKDKKSLELLFSSHKPQIVLHAAAHKHVTLVENNSIEAIKNNVLGTKNIIELCISYEVERFVMISTDKAVNSSSVMGATKRLSEMIVLDSAQKSKLNFSIVRFGNVLGSRGSVIRTFNKQIEEGLHLSVSHPEITRFFMSIPEAVQLVLQASALSTGREIFVLDMGEPIKILDLAKDMIRLSGLNEGTDIRIEFSGLRPGEKLYEELFVKGEVYEKTSHEKIMIARNASQFIATNLNEKVENLITSVDELNKNEIIAELQKIIPEFNHIKNDVIR